MSSWTKGELKKIADTGDLHISPFREDGMTYGTPTWTYRELKDGRNGQSRGEERDANKSARK